MLILILIAVFTPLDLLDLLHGSVQDDPKGFTVSLPDKLLSSERRRLKGGF